MNLQRKMLYSSTLRELIDIKKEYGMNADTSINLKDAVDTMPLLVPVVGEFSAGKSTMLNKLIGKDILGVAMSPKTAIPAELYYSVEEYDEGVYADGRTERMPDVSLAVGKCVCVRRYINSPFLKNIEPIVLVDMPGFDSANHEHTAAIASYLDRGIHYAVLIPVEDGTLTASMQRQIENILDFNKTCTFFVSRTDNRSPEEIAQVKEQLENKLAMLMGETEPVYAVNKDDVSIFTTFIQTLQPDELFKQQFKDVIIDECYDARNTLNTRIAALKSDREQNARAIKELAAGIEKIESKKQKMLDQAQHDSFSDEADAVAAAVGSELNANLDNLVVIAESGGQNALQEELSSIVQSTVISKIQSVMTSVSVRFGRDLEGELSELNALFAQYNAPDTLSRLQQSAEVLFTSTKQTVTAYIERRRGRPSPGIGYKTITGVLAAATSFIAPWLEIIIIFLPEILSLILGPIRKRQEQEKIRQIILSQIPAIKRQIRTKVVELLKENSSNIIATLSEKFDTELKNKKLEIENVQKNSEAHASEIAAEIEKLTHAVSKIETLLEQILA